MDNRETILRFIQTNGPILPAKIAKLLNTEILLASAQLSELVDNKKLRISNTKVGGSPLYYLEGQERRLQEFTDNLNEKDRQAVTLLKEKKVTKDRDLEPLMRVSMRAIKDFAVPLQVTYNNQKQLFWKYYLVDGDEAQEIIKSYLQPNGISKKVESNILAVVGLDFIPFISSAFSSNFLPTNSINSSCVFISAPFKFSN